MNVNSKIIILAYKINLSYIDTHCYFDNLKYALNEYNFIKQKPISHDNTHRLTSAWVVTHLVTIYVQLTLFTAICHTK